MKLQSDVGLLREIEKEIKAILKRYKSQRRKIQEGSMIFFSVNKQFLFSLNKVYACRVSLHVAKEVGWPEWDFQHLGAVLRSCDFC